MEKMDPGQMIAQAIDHTLLKPEATPDQVAKLCAEAKEYGFASVCVNPVNVQQCAEALGNTAVKVCSVVGFPLGATLPDVKAYETELAISAGATEIDMVMNIGALKAGLDEVVSRDIEAVVQAAHRRNVLVKVIIEAALLTDEEKERACRLASSCARRFVKTSTGFGPVGRQCRLQLMRRVSGRRWRQGGRWHPQYQTAREK